MLVSYSSDHVNHVAFLRSLPGPFSYILQSEFTWAVACDFQQCDILTCVDSDEPVQPFFNRRNSK